MTYTFVSYENELKFVNDKNETIAYAKLVVLKHSSGNVSLEVFKAVRDLDVCATYGEEIHPLFDEKCRVVRI